MCHVSCVMCHVSRVMCHMSCVICFKGSTRVIRWAQGVYLDGLHACNKMGSMRVIRWTLNQFFHAKKIHEKGTYPETDIATL